MTFTSRPATVSIVTHYSHSPIGTNAASGGHTEGGALTLSPKGQRNRDSNVATGGVGSMGSASDSQPGTSGTPPTSSSFIGQVSSATTCSYFGKGCNPPDMALAASPSYVLQGVNTQWEVLDTSGHVQPGWPVSAQNFFGTPNATDSQGAPCDTAHGSQPFLSDPRALYDAADGRFWAAELQVENALGIAPDCAFKSVFWVAVSKTANPSQGWNVYEFNTSLDGQFANDYTQIGLNGEAVYISANMFGPSTGPNGGFYAELFEANKAQMERGKANFTPDAFYDLLGTGPASGKVGPFVADTVHPAMNIDASAGSTEVFADTIDGPDPINGHFCGFTGLGLQDSCSGLAVWEMSNPIAHDSGGPAPTLTGTYVPTDPFLVSPPQTQPSCSQCVDSLDLRLTGTPVIRNGMLYGSWDTAVRNASRVVPGLEWAQVDLSKLGSQSAATTAYYNFTGDGSATFGALMPDAQGNVLMVFDHMSSTVFPQIRYIVKGAGQANFSGPGLVLKAGESSYRPELCGTSVIPVCRWGDYEATSFDGAGHIWFSSQYANLYQGLNTPPQYGRNWSTWIGAIAAS